MERYVQSSEEDLLKAIREEVTGSQETVRETEDQSNEETWSWLKQGSLKRETEALITAAQDQAIRTNYIKATIDKSQIDAKCRMCRDKNETVSHIFSGCSKLGQKDTRNDMIMWPGQSTWICRENAGSTGMINITITSLRAYWKMRTTNSFGNSVYEQTFTSRLGDQI